MVTYETARRLAKKYRIDLRRVPLKYFRRGINAELEHRNITHGDLDITVKIVIAHLEEAPDYYQRLEILEAEADKFWEGKVKRIFLA
jgi:hypothetical protein